MSFMVLLASIPLAILHVEMSSVAPPTFTPLIVPHLEMSSVAPLAFTPLIVPHVEMSSVVPPISIPSTILHVEMSFVVSPTFIPSIVPRVEMSSVVPLTSTPLIVLHVEMSYVVPPTSTPSIVPHVEMSLMVPLYQCWHCKWFHFAPCNFLCLYLCVSYSLFTLKHEAPPSSTLFFFLKAFLGEFVATFFLFSSVVYISSLVLKPWSMVFIDSPFDAQINIERFLPILRLIDMHISYPFYSP
jgi:hypothetical protein